MNARTTQVRGAADGRAVEQPKIDYSLYEKSHDELIDAIAHAKESRKLAQEMLTLEMAELDRKPKKIEVQSQVLHLRDYIFSKDNLISQLDGQLVEVNRVLDTRKKSAN